MGFAENLKRARENRGLSQEELARCVNIQGSHVSRYERGQVKPSIDVLMKFAEALEISVDSLVFDDPGTIEQDRILDRSALERLKRIQQLTTPDKKLVIEFLDAFLTKRQLETMLK